MQFDRHEYPAHEIGIENPLAAFIGAIRRQALANRKSAAFAGFEHAGGARSGTAGDGSAGRIGGLREFANPQISELDRRAFRL
jgi:hypothetical protein